MKNFLMRYSDYIQILIQLGIKKGRTTGRHHETQCLDTPSVTLPDTVVKPANAETQCQEPIVFELCMSLVDCPGHDSFMSTMINGAAVMNIAINVIAANQFCPQEQTAEHLQATEILGVDKYILVQNKLDLVNREEAKKNASQIKAFTKNTQAENAPIIPTQVQNKTRSKHSRRSFSRTRN